MVNVTPIHDEEAELYEKIEVVESHNNDDSGNDAEESDKNSEEPTEAEKEALGEELVSVREVVLLPGKSYDITIKVPGDATAIGIAGMFRVPYQGRWKLAFDNKLSFDNGITIGAHACAFNASKGVLVADISPDSMRSLVGVQCNS